MKHRSPLISVMRIHRLPMRSALVGRAQFCIATAGACLGLACGDHEGTSESQSNSSSAGNAGASRGGSVASSGGTRSSSANAGSAITVGGTSSARSVSAGGGASSDLTSDTGGTTSTGDGAKGGLGSTPPNTTWPNTGGAGGDAGGAGGLAGTAVGSAGADSTRDRCDDRNPCTLDQWQQGVGCSHVATADGSSCDDGSSCTTQDQCASGVCVGTAFSSEAQVLGSVGVFGRGPELPDWFGGHARVRGVAGFLSQSRAVFVDESTRQSQVSLVEVGSSGLRRLDSMSTSRWVTGSNISGWVWTFQPGIDIVPLSPTRFALLGGGLEVYDTTGDRLRLLWRASPWIDALAAVGRDDRLFVCTEFGGRVYRLAASGEPILEQELSSVSVGHCISLSLSEDGNTLYAAGIGGAQSFQLSSAGAAPVKQQDLSARATYRVLSNSAFVVHQAIQSSMGWGDISVYKPDDLTSTIAVFPYETPEGTPLGFALMGSGIVVLRGDTGRGREVVSASYYELGDFGATLMSKVEIYQRAQSENDFPDLVQLASAGPYLAVQPLGRILRLHEASGALVEVTGTEQGYLDWLRPVSANAVLARSTHSGHLIDVSDPRAPRIASGGYLPLSAQPLQIELPESTTQPPILGSLRVMGSSKDVVSLTAVQGESPLTVAGTVLLQDGPLRLWQQGSSLFALKSGVASDTLREYSLFGLHAASDQVLPQLRESSLVIAPGSPVELGPGGEVFTAKSAESDAQLLQRFVRATTGQFTLAGERTLPSGQGVLLRAASNGVLFVSSDSVYVLENTQDLRVSASLRLSENWLELTSILRYTPTEIVLGISSSRAGSQLNQSGVLVLRTADLARIAEYDLPEPALAMAQAGPTLTFATGNQLVTASPRCPAVPVAPSCPTIGALSCKDVKTVQICSAVTGNWEPTTSCIDSCSGGKCLSAVSVQAGHALSCAQISDGTARCWGEARLLGANLASPTTAFPATVLAEDKTAALAGIEDLAVGAQHACARLTGGSLRCWGLGAYGELGNKVAKTNALNTVATPAYGDDLAPLSGVQQVAAKGHNTCALLSDTTVRCFGDGAQGQLGNGEGGPGVKRAAAVNVVESSQSQKPLSGVQQVAVGYLHACALMSDTTVRCWGNNELGQLGNGRAGVGQRSSTPEVVLAPDGLNPLSNVRQLALGYTHSCALLADGTAVCWGEGREGQLGQSLSSGVESSDLPLSVPMSGIKQIDAGWSFTCALLADSTVQCFGSGTRGERGDGVTGETHYGATPSTTQDSLGHAMTKLSDVSAGFHTLCLRDRTSTVSCAGANLEGFTYPGTSSALAKAVHW